MTRHGQWHGANVAPRTNRNARAVANLAKKKKKVTNLMGPLEFDRQRVCPINFEVLPPLAKSTGFRKHSICSVRLILFTGCNLKEKDSEYILTGISHSKCHQKNETCNLIFLQWVYVSCNAAEASYVNTHASIARCRPQPCHANAANSEFAV